MWSPVAYGAPVTVQQRAVNHLSFRAACFRESLFIMESTRPGNPKHRLRKLLAAVAIWPLLACTAELGSTPQENSTPGGQQPGEDGEAPGELLPFEPQAGLLRRLTRAQFRNAVHEVTGVEVDVNELQADSYSSDFASVGASTVVTSNRGAEQYISVVEKAVSDLFSDETRATSFLGCAPEVGDASCYRSFFERVGRKAWRRPLTVEETDRLVGVSQNAELELESALDGALWGTVALLASPHFLYRSELGTAEGDSRRLVGFEMASRLSFLLWNTVPDEKLLDAAESGALSTKEDIVAAATWMLDTPAGREAVAAFAEEYMRLDRISGQAKDGVLYPQFGPALKEAMVVDMRETWSIVAFDQNQSVLDLMSTRTVVANADLARLYGLNDSGMAGDSFIELTLPEDSPRAGILNKAGFLSQYANQIEGSPTLRGKFIQEAFLCTHVPAPPGDIALELPAALPEKPTTKRERLAAHNNQPACAKCHTMMDPMGFPLEQFDAIGQFRTTELGLDIDTTGEFMGTPVDDGKHLGAVMSSSEEIAACIVRKYYSYALGREEGKTDKGTLLDLSSSFKDSGHRFRQLILDVVSNDAFALTKEQADLQP